jgi:hypothetical protein
MTQANHRASQREDGGRDDPVVVCDLLADGPRTSGGIFDEFIISRIAVLKHIGVLHEAGLVTPRYNAAGVLRFAYVLPAGAPAAEPAQYEGEGFRLATSGRLRPRASGSQQNDNAARRRERGL